MGKLLGLGLVIWSLVGCSATWSGIKQDTSNAADWSKTKINEGASYVKEKTE